MFEQFSLEPAVLLLKNFPAKSLSHHFFCVSICFLCCSSARFEGSLNMDLNEIAMNLVPFPHLHYLVPSLTPLYPLADVSVPTRRSAVWLSLQLILPHSSFNGKEVRVLSSYEHHPSLKMCLMLTAMMTLDTS